MINNALGAGLLGAAKSEVASYVNQGKLSTTDADYIFNQLGL